MTYDKQTLALTVHTTAAETALETLYSNALDFIVGTAIELPVSGSGLTYGLWTLSGTTWYEASSSSATPTSAGTVPHVKQ